MTKKAASSSITSTSTASSIKDLRRRGRSSRPRRPATTPPVKMKRKAAESADLPTAIISSKKASKKAKENVQPIILTTASEDKSAADEVPDVADFQVQIYDIGPFLYSLYFYRWEYTRKDLKFLFSINSIGGENSIAPPCTS